MTYPRIRCWAVLLSALLLSFVPMQGVSAASNDAKTEPDSSYNKAINDFNDATRTFDKAKVAATISELQALTQSPQYQNDPVVHNLLGYLFLTQNDAVSAIPELQTTVRLKPDNLDARNNLGNALRQTGQYADAAAQYQYILDHPAAKGGPDPTRVKFNLATVLGQSGKLDPALALFSSLVASGTADAATYKNYGFFLQKAGRSAEAAAALDKAATLNPKDASSALSAGELYASAGQYDSAIADLTKALGPEADPKLDPASQYDAHFALAESYAAKGDNPNGIKEFSAAAALQPQNAVPSYNQGVLEEQSGLNAAAETSYRSALQKDPTNLQVQTALGLLLAQEGGHDAEAASLLAHASSSLPQDVKAAPIYASLGDVYARQHDYARSDTARRAALQLRPDDTDTRVALADTYMAQHQYVTALSQYNSAAVARPTDAAIQNQRGVALKFLRQYPKALVAFQKAAALSPSDAQVQNNLGVIYELLGKKASAVAAYKRALALNPQLGEARRNLQRFVSR